MNSVLTEKEKLFIRATVIHVRMLGRRCSSKNDLLMALKEAKNHINSQTVDYNSKVSAAKLLKRNCFLRVHKPCAWVPCHFKSRLFLGQNDLSKKALNVLKKLYSRYKRKTASDRGDRILNSKAKIWMLSVHSPIHLVIDE